MFRSINADTADAAYQEATQLFAVGGPAKFQASRLGRTLEVPRVAISISNPRNRYVFSRSPAINPAFAIAEVVWIMTGRNDSSFLNYFNRSLPEFAGTSPTYDGAYGHRLRKSFGIDQLARAAESLRANRDSRQVVLQIWDARNDLPLPCGAPASCDVPCNITSMLKIRDNRLEWTQVLRSNDLFRGVPYNFIQFMTMQEIVAGWIGVEPGCYGHLSDSLHVYESDFEIIERGTQRSQSHDAARLNSSFDDTIESLRRIASHVDELVAAKSTSFDFVGTLDSSKLPQSYRNLLCILFAEAARRNERHDQIEKIMRRCYCESLTRLVDNWLARFGVKSV